MSQKRFRPMKKDSLSELCSQLGEDDGVDPKRSPQSRFDRRGPTDRKTLQLCHQVAHAVEYVLTGETLDDDLSCLHVQSVIPASHRGHLLVTVTPGPLEPASSADVILTKLKELSRRFRAEMSIAITRRKVPELTFAYLPCEPQEERHA